MSKHKEKRFFLGILTTESVFYDGLGRGERQPGSLSALFNCWKSSTSSLLTKTHFVRQELCNVFVYVRLWILNGFCPPTYTKMASPLPITCAYKMGPVPPSVHPITQDSGLIVQIVRRKWHLISWTRCTRTWSPVLLSSHNNKWLMSLLPRWN